MEILAARAVAQASSQDRISAGMSLKLAGSGGSEIGVSGARVVGPVVVGSVVLVTDSDVEVSTGTRSSLNNCTFWEGECTYVRSRLLC